jgi:hypothetical protein
MNLFPCLPGQEEDGQADTGDHTGEEAAAEGHP